MYNCQTSKYGFLILLLGIYFLSCTQPKHGNILSNNQEKEILSVELDDEILEEEVGNSRNLTKSLLNLDKLSSLGLNEVYLQEEPLAINFLDQDQNMLLFEALNWSDKEIDMMFDDEKRNNNSIIKQQSIDNVKVKYAIENKSSSRKIIAIYYFDHIEVKLKMAIFSKEDVEVLFAKYSKLIKGIT